MQAIKRALALLIQEENATHQLIPYNREDREGGWWPKERRIDYTVGRSEAWMVRIVLHEVVHMLLDPPPPQTLHPLCDAEYFQYLARQEQQTEAIAIRVWRSWGYPPLVGWYGTSYWWRAPQYDLPSKPYRNRPIERRLIALQPTA